MGHKDGNDDSGLCLTDTGLIWGLFKQKSTRPRLRSQTKEIKGGGKVCVQRSQSSMSCLGRGSASNLLCCQRTSCAILHGLYTLCLIHSPHPITCHISSPDLNTLLVAKKKRKPLISYFSRSLSRYLCPSPSLDYVMFLSFYLNS